METPNSEHQYEADGVSESLYSGQQEEGGGPPCPGCLKPTQIKDGRFFCNNRERDPLSPNGFKCPFQTPMDMADVSDFIPEEQRRTAQEESPDSSEPLVTEASEESGSGPEAIEGAGEHAEEPSSLKVYEKIGDQEPQGVVPEHAGSILNSSQERSDIVISGEDLAKYYKEKTGASVTPDEAVKRFFDANLSPGGREEIIMEMAKMKGGQAA